MPRVTCIVCLEPFDAPTDRRKYCSDRCRQAGRRAGGAQAVEEQNETLPPEIGSTADGASAIDIHRAVLRTLSEAGRLDSVAGQQAALIAQRMVHPRTPAAAIAPLSRELRTALTEALRESAQKDPVQQAEDEIARRRAAHGG